MNHIVDSLLAAAELPAGPAEKRGLAQAYAAQKSAVDALYAVPMDRWVAPSHWTPKAPNPAADSGPPVSEISRTSR